MVQHEDLAKVRGRSAQQVQAVALRFGKRLFVAVDNAFRVLTNLAQRDEALTRVDGCIIAGRGEFLGVEIEARFSVRQQNFLRPPRLQVFRRPGIHIVLSVVGGMLLSQNDAYQVIRACSIIAALHLRCDFVVRLGYQVRNCIARGIVSQCLKGEDFSHEKMILTSTLE